jgi:glucuronate isomerase
MLNPDRYFDPDPTIRATARSLYAKVRSLPLVCPHGHVDPWILAENTPFPDPTELIIVPDHYIFRMFYSRGIPLESLGVPRQDGGPVQTDHRKIWQTFGENFYLFRGTPTSCWLKHEFEEVFGVRTPLNGQTAMTIYDQIAEQLRRPEFLPRALYERFNIEVLVTTDAATDTLAPHRKIRESGWKGRVLPTFRPDKAVSLLQPGWRDEILKLGQVTGREVGTFRDYIAALEDRRRFFIAAGATSTDHAVLNPLTLELPESQLDAIFGRALQGAASQEDADLFTAHMLMEFARMSVEDGLVMQLHAGSYRNHNQVIAEKFGADKGCDIPVTSEFTRNLAPLLNKYGNDPRLRLILFTLDESTYARELAPLAGHYPAVRLGPAWWFHDSREGMTRFRRRVTETAGIYNTVGFNDDTRAFLSIPARHDLSRRVDCNFLASLVSEHVIEMDDAEQMIVDLSYRLVKEAYRL